MLFDLVDKNGKRIQPNAVAGDLKFVDANGDGVINDKDRQYCGNAMPETTFAFSMGCSYKKLSVSAMLQGVGGAQSLYMTGGGGPSEPLLPLRDAA